jgi:hypothetical protein
MPEEGHLRFYHNYIIYALQMEVLWKYKIEIIKW